MTRAYSKSDLDGVRVGVQAVGTLGQVISEERPAAGAVDQDAARLEHRDRVFGGDDARGAPYQFEVRLSIRSLTDRSMAFSGQNPGPAGRWRRQTRQLVRPV
jgi:hypothetical protein